MAVTHVLGASVKRREDPRLLTGRSAFLDDIPQVGLLHAEILRSPYAHARIRQIDIRGAQANRDVIAVLTGEEADRSAGTVPCLWTLPPDLKVPKQPTLALRKVLYVGQPVAVVVATTQAAAVDAAQEIRVDYEPLAAVTDAEKALAAGAPILHEDIGTNQVSYFKVAAGDVEKAFAEADVVVKERLVNSRMAGAPIEGRGVLADYNPGSGDLTVRTSTQIPHFVKTLLASALRMKEQRVRVITPEVGGGFGTKLNFYNEEILIGLLAKKLGRPVKWVETRSENLQSTIHGRDQVHYIELAAKKDGTIIGMRDKFYADLGAYHQIHGAGLFVLTALMMQAQYKIPNMLIELHAVFTNKMANDATRGASRPEATYAVERIMDVLAAELKMDPAELRRRNYLAAESFPYSTLTGLVYDSGNYGPLLDKALAVSGYEGLRREQERARREGRYMGIGLAGYVEVSGWGPSTVAGAVGIKHGNYDSATVRTNWDGTVTVLSGTSPHGQGHETAWAQIAADALGIGVDDIAVAHGDTAQVQFGSGTYGSRSTAVGGTAVRLAAEEVRDKAVKIAAHLLEARVEDMEYVDGRARVKGSPTRAFSFADIAAAAHTAHKLPPETQPGLESTHFFDPSNFTYPFGVHVAAVEIDPETGRISIKRYVAVDDCGKVVNPMIVDGQVHGGVAMGIGQALLEEIVYDEDGQLKTGTFVDYLLPSAADLPNIETARTETPSPVNVLGAKGVGEAGTIVGTATIANAVLDALQPLGIRNIDIPLTPEKVWRAIRNARAGAHPDGGAKP
jgi:carbon-monoxide dehydrogenase large subunit